MDPTRDKLIGQIEFLSKELGHLDIVNLNTATIEELNLQASILRQRQRLRISSAYFDLMKTRTDNKCYGEEHEKMTENLNLIRCEFLSPNLSMERELEIILLLGINFICNITSKFGVSEPKIDTHKDKPV